MSDNNLEFSAELVKAEVANAINHARNGEFYLSSSPPLIFCSTGLSAFVLDPEDVEGHVLFHRRKEFELNLEIEKDEFYITWDDWYVISENCIIFNDKETNKDKRIKLGSSDRLALLSLGA